jgi:molecular chaperone GrpE
MREEKTIENVEEMPKDSEGTAEAQEQPKEQPKSELETAKAEAADYKDRWMRGQAEFQNYRKRIDRERVEMRATASADIVKQLLPVLDDFDRAFKAVSDEMKSNPVLDGFRLIERKFNQTLEQAGVTVIPTVGKQFDPNYHESVADEESDKPHGTILEEYRRGYLMGDKVLRPAMVKIAK